MSASRRKVFYQCVFIAMGMIAFGLGATAMPWTLAAAAVGVVVLLVMDRREDRQKLIFDAEYQHQQLATGDRLIGMHGKFPPADLTNGS